jgi:hypothetical protein
VVREAGELLVGDAVEFPVVTRSDAVPGADLIAADALVRGRRAVGDVTVHPGEELALGTGIAPGVGFELPPADGLDKCGQVMVAAGLLERGIEFAVIASQGLGVGVGGQDGADRGRSACGAIADVRVS